MESKESTALFFQNPSYLRKLLSDYLHRDLPSSFFEKLQHVSALDLFQATGISLLLLGLILRTQPQLSTLLGVFMVGIVFMMWIMWKSTTQEQKLSKKKKKLSKLERVLQTKSNPFHMSARSLLHRQPVLVKIFSSLYVLARFDEENFQEALVKANQLIRVHESATTGVVIPAQYVDVSEQLARDSLNHIQSMIHSMPSSSLGDYRMETTIQVLQEALEKLVKDIKDKADEQYYTIGPDIHTPPPCSRSGPWANPIEDKEYNPHFSFYW